MKALSSLFDTKSAPHKSKEKVGAIHSDQPNCPNRSRASGVSCYKINLFALLWRHDHGFPKETVPTMSLGKLPQSVRRLVGSLSVRTRIILLALIPVIGFLTNGYTYVAGEGDVSGAFDTAESA